LTSAEPRSPTDIASITTPVAGEEETVVGDPLGPDEDGDAVLVHAASNNARATAEPIDTNVPRVPFIRPLLQYFALDVDLFRSTARLPEKIVRRSSL
jgi:hypothetical protein